MFMDAFIGEIRAFANTFYPLGWLPCNGDRVPIMGNEALFSIIGAIYGPTDGQSYFTLPDLRGTAMVGNGQSSQGGLNLPLGQSTGSETIALTTDQVPAHSHSFNGATGSDITQLLSSPDSAGTSCLSNIGYKNAAGSQVSTPGYVDQAIAPVTLNPGTVQLTGGNTQSACAAHDNMAPYLAINYYICAQDGYYPVRP
jgi:microcystin-dependent protein